MAIGQKFLANCLVYQLEFAHHKTNNMQRLEGVDGFHREYAFENFPPMLVEDNRRKAVELKMAGIPSTYEKFKGR